MAGETILIVDDDPFMRDLLTESLSELEYQTIPAETGKEALHAISTNEIHVALIDLSLGDTDGLEVVDTIIDGSPDTQIIIMTGYPSIQSAIDALRRGAQDYIIKPFKMPEIQAALTRSLKNQRLEAEVRQLRQKVRDQEHEILQLRTRTGGSVAGTPRPRPVGRPTGLPGAYGGAPVTAPPQQDTPPVQGAPTIVQEAPPEKEAPLEKRAPPAKEAPAKEAPAENPPGEEPSAPSQETTPAQEEPPVGAEPNPQSPAESE